MAKPRFLSLNGVRILVSYFKDQLSGKVDKVDGKSLSDNNFSDEEKAKLAGIEADSQVNVIESISVNGTDQTIINKNVNIDVPLVDDALQNEGQAADAKATGNAIDELSQSLSSTATEIRGEIADEVADIEQSISAVQESIPTNISQLNNDAEYTSKTYVDNQISSVQSSIPTDVSQLNNDVEYTDKNYVDSQIGAVQSSIPTNVSDLTNDSNFTTQTYVDTELAKKQDTINFATPTSSDVGKALMPKTVENDEVTEWEFGEAGMVDDVQINGTSIVANKVANIPLAGTDNLGVIRVDQDGDGGIWVDNQGYIKTVRASNSQVKAGTNTLLPIVPRTIDVASFYGLAKVSGDITQSQSENPVGTYTEEAKSAIQSMLGIDTAIADAVSGITGLDFSIAVKVFPTVASMIADSTLKNGDNVATRGYYASGDNGGANYAISSSHTGALYLTLSNGLFANRLDENGIVKAESIGVKAYAAATDNPDQSDMDNNVTIVNNAIGEGIRLIFGKGHYYFSDCIRFSRQNTQSMFGIDRDVVRLHFPYSNGLYFDQPIYYNYYMLRGFSITSYGHCIVCDEQCLTVLDSHFEWLSLTSENGDCFHAPQYNIAKYTSQGGGSTVYDTCVQNCVFDYINASAPNGAAFCNIMGMYTYYMHMNLVSCKYGFRNCDGIIEQLNTLGTSEDYFIYYDKANSHSLRWMFINMNAEGVAKAFIYTEPEVQPAAGEDPKKPETANIMTITKMTAINSGWSLSGGTENNDVYPITVHSIQTIDLINSLNLIVPSAYPGSYDTSAVNAHILARRAPGITKYNGGPDITVYDATGNQLSTRFGDNNTRVGMTNSTNGGYNDITSRNMPIYNELQSNLFFGGKNIDVWEVKCSEIGGQPTPPIEKAFFDVAVFDVDTESDKRIISLAHGYESRYPGRVIMVANKTSSLHNLIFNCVNTNRNSSSYALSTKIKSDVVLAPGESIVLYVGYDKHLTNGSTIRTWWPFDSKYYYNDDTILYKAIKATSPKTILPVVEGYYIRNNTNQVDVGNVLESLVTTGTHGMNYVLTECSPGDKFTIINGAGGADDARLYAFISSSGANLQMAGSRLVSDEITITAPNNAVYLIVNSYRKPIVFKSN